MRTGGGDGRMDNDVQHNGHEGCTRGSGGYCRHDMFVHFQNKVGAGCNTRWLFNNARWKRGNDGKNKDDAFDSAGWDCFNWNEVNCVSGNGFYVPNKVCTLSLELLVSVLTHIFIQVAYFSSCYFLNV